MLARLLCGALVVLVLGFLGACSGGSYHDVYNEYYAGTITKDGTVYTVLISENLNTDDFLRIVHMDPVAGSSLKDIRSVTGHGGNAGDLSRWDSVFYGCSDTSGTVNEANRNKLGWDFKPCLADTGTTKP
ncbi:MAG TPA: hypothetical protein VMJ72_01230, partial [Candidatus Paceibacterota bacterium]|nr:hypothetical protein [Candidatus Paceibacterota bacterium]